jgi:hypothetical protein
MAIHFRICIVTVFVLLLAPSGSHGGDNKASPAAGPAAQSPGLTALPTAEGILLHVQNVSAAGPSSSIYRWTDGDAPRVLPGSAGKAEFLDREAEINRIYYYRLEGGSGAAIGVRSDPGREFNCRGLPEVPAALLGVDRSEIFVTPRGERISFTVSAPKRVGPVFKVPPCAGKKGCSDLANIEAALAMAKTSGGGRIQLSAGDYELHPSASANPYSQLGIGGVSDLVLAGAAPQGGAPATHIVFDAGSAGGRNFGAMTGLGIADSHRVIVKDVSLDWSKPLALPGKIVNSGKDQHFVVEDGPYYIPYPAYPPAVVVIDGYDFKTRTYVQATWSRTGYAPGDLKFNPHFPDGGYYYELRGQAIPDGSTVTGIAASGAAVRVSGDTSDIAFEGVHIYGGGASGFSFGPNGRGFRISNSKITRKPDRLLKPGERPRLISLRGDSNARATQGGILIESSEFAFTDDDGFNIVAVMVQGAEGTRFPSASEIEFVFKGFNPFAHPWGVEDTLSLFDPETLKPLSGGPLRVASRKDAYDTQTGTYSFHFQLASPLPELMGYQGRPADKLPYFSDPRYISAPFVLRNNCLRDSAGGRFVAQSGPGLIENNIVANTGTPGIDLTASPTYWREGPGASGVTVRNNKVVGTGYWLTDRDAKGNLLGYSTGWIANAGISVGALSAAGFAAKGFPNSWLQISGNYIANTPGVGLLVAAASFVELRDNVIVNANAVPFVKDYGADYCGAKSQGFRKDRANQPWCLARTPARGALMVTHSQAVQVLNNTLLGTSAGVFIDREH